MFKAYILLQLNIICFQQRLDSEETSVRTVSLLFEAGFAAVFKITVLCLFIAVYLWCGHCSSEPNSYEKR